MEINAIQVDAAPTTAGSEVATGKAGPDEIAFAKALQSALGKGSLAATKSPGQPIDGMKPDNPKEVKKQEHPGAVVTANSVVSVILASAIEATSLAVPIAPIPPNETVEVTAPATAGATMGTAEPKVPANPARGEITPPAASAGRSKTRGRSAGTASGTQ